VCWNPVMIEGSGTDGALEDRLLAMVGGDILGVEVEAGSDLFEAGLESMGIMQVVLRIEREMGVVVPEGEVTRENFRTVAGLTAMVRRLAGGGG
jgi:acyl carrier protein